MFNKYILILLITPSITKTMVSGWSTDHYFGIIQQPADTPIKTAINNNDLSTIKQLINENSALLDQNFFVMEWRDGLIEYMTPLEYACTKKQWDIAEWLVEQDCSINCIINRYEQNTPLHEAASHKRTKLIYLLLAKGANPEATNKKGLTPLASMNTLHWDDESILTALRLVAHGASLLAKIYPHSLDPDSIIFIGDLYEFHDNKQNVFELVFCACKYAIEEQQIDRLQKLLNHPDKAIKYGIERYKIALSKLILSSKLPTQHSILQLLPK